MTSATAHDIGILPKQEQELTMTNGSRTPEMDESVRTGERPDDGMSRIFPGEPVWQLQSDREKKIFALAVSEGLTWKQASDKYGDLS